MHYCLIFKVLAVVFRDSFVILSQPSFLVNIFFELFSFFKKNNSDRSESLPQTGIEPVREYKSRRILSPVRLPVPPRRHYDGAYRARTCDPLLVRQMLSQLS